MKSLSKVHPQVVPEQLRTWTVAELDVEFAIPTDSVQTEQILAIFRNEEKNAGELEKRSQSSLHPLATNLAVTAWQPQEIEVQPPQVKSYEWGLMESPVEVDLDEKHEDEIWQEVINPEKEAVTLLTQARAQAEEIILEARAAADKIILQAQDEIDQEKKEGFQQGWDEARNELRETLNAIHAVAEDVRQWQGTLMAQGEETLVEMLKEIAQTMFGEGVHLDASALQINLNRVMEHAQKLGDLNIFLNTADAGILDSSWSEYQLLITGNRVKIIPSEKIKPGGCIVKGNMGMVDARVETQLAAVLNSIEETRGASE